MVALESMMEAALDNAGFSALMRLLNPGATGFAQVPESVLTEIFHIAVMDPLTSAVNFKRRASLMAVCRQWRYLVTVTPAFWTYFDFHKAKSISVQDALVMLHTHFDRSPATHFLNLDLSNFEDGELDLKALHNVVTQRVQGCLGLKITLATSTQIQHFLPLHPVFSGLSGLWADIGLSTSEVGANMDVDLGRPFFATQIGLFNEVAPVNLSVSIGTSYGVDFGTLNTSRLVSMDIRTQSVIPQSSIVAERLHSAAFFGPGTPWIVSALYSPRLRHLSLQGMHFSCDLDVQWIANAIGRMDCLEVFQLHFASHVQQAHGISRAIIPALAGLPMLREVHVRNRNDFYSWRQRFIDICVRQEYAFGRLEHVFLDNQEHWPDIFRVAIYMRPNSVRHGLPEGDELWQHPKTEDPIEDLPSTPDIAYNDADTDEEEEVFSKLVNGTMYQSLIGDVHR